MFLGLPGGACGGADPRPVGTADSLPNGLLLALSQFEVSPEGKVLPKPRAALLEILVRRDGAWEVISLEDPESNVFHKAMIFEPGGGAPAGILTLGGTGAALKLWRKGPSGFTAETLWRKDFGGKHNRMREAEVLLLADGRAALAVATHDQGVVAIVARGDDGWTVQELDHKKNTFVHEIEIGDLDGDGTPEVYATPSDPNLFDGRPQPGKVLRYAPEPGANAAVVADLGDRHAKEILVHDVDGDGRDELYVSVEAVAGGRLEIRRYDADTDPAAGQMVTVLEDRLCRFLTAGDVDGDGRREIVAAAHKTGLWLLRPPDKPGATWNKRSIDRASSGFEHAALLADLDEDGTDELYVASDDQGEVRRYVWKDGRFVKEVLLRRDIPDSVFTWNLMPVPRSLVE
ncbi:MAG: FG-GAP repeat domain-containing protein [Planctomycetota bacterium]